MKIRRRPRKLKTRRDSFAPTTKSETTITVEKSHAKQIAELPRFQKEFVIQAIQDGANNSSIARYFLNEGWLKVSERTFVQYLTAYKRLFADEIYDQDLPANQNRKNLGAAATIKGTTLDEEVELEQLVRLQKSRLAIGHKFEKNSQMLLPNFHKDISTTKDLVETLAKVRGKLQTGAGRPDADSTSRLHPEAQEQLQKAARNENVQDKLSGLLGKLSVLMEAKAGEGA